MTQLANTSSTPTHTHTHTHYGTLKATMKAHFLVYCLNIWVLFCHFMVVYFRPRKPDVTNLSTVSLSGWVGVSLLTAPFWERSRELCVTMLEGVKPSGIIYLFLYWHRSDNKCGKVSCARPKDERASGATANMLCASEVFHVLRYYAARLVIRDNLPQGQAARVFWDVNAAWYRSPRRFGLLDPRRWDRTVVLKHR